MELEELKKSWNALDEHLKDKELIKEEELGKLIGHAVFQRVENILQNAAFAFIAEEIAHFGFGNEGPGGDVRAELVHQHVVAELGFEVAGGVALGLDHADIGVG